MKSEIVSAASLILFFTTGASDNVVAQNWTVPLHDVNNDNPNVSYLRAESVEFLPDGKTIATAGYSYDGLAKSSIGEVRLRNVVDGSIIARLHGTLSASYTIRAGALSTSPNGKRIAAAGFARKDGGVISVIDLFDAEEEKFLRTFKGYAWPISCITVSPDSKSLAVALSGGAVELWNLQSGELLETLPAHPHGSWAVAFSPDGNILAMGEGDGSVSFWNSETAEKVGELPAKHRGEFHGALAFSPDGRRFASCTHRRWKWTEVRDKQIKGQKRKREKDGERKLIEVPVGGSATMLWEVNRENGKKIMFKKQNLLPAHEAHTYSLVFSPDSTILVSANQDTTVKVWDVARDREIATITDHADFVYDAAFSPDGKLLATLSRDSMKLWNVGEREDAE